MFSQAEKALGKRITRCAALLFTILLLTSFTGLAADEASLPPVDESANVPALARFLERLGDAVQERDASFVLAALASDARFSFGPDENNPAAVAAALADSGSTLWQELEAALSLGGTFVATGERPVFCMPYVYSAFPNRFDSFAHQVITEPSVMARSTPDSSASAIALPDYAIVETDPGSAKVVEGRDGHRWVKVYLNDAPAYVAAESIRSPLASRTCLRESGGQWEISAIISGD